MKLSPRPCPQEDVCFKVQMSFSCCSNRSYSENKFFKVVH